MSASATRTEPSPFRGYRFPPEIIAHAVWLYFRFHLSFRDVQDLLAERGIIVSHEAVRQWSATFGPAFASGLRRRRARPGDKWHIDEALLKINGKRHWLWRAVDQNGVVLDILVQQRRDQLPPSVSCGRLSTVSATNLASSSPISWRATHRRFDECYPTPSIDDTSV